MPRTGSRLSRLPFEICLGADASARSPSVWSGGASSLAASHRPRRWHHDAARIASGRCLRSPSLAVGLQKGGARREARLGSDRNASGEPLHFVRRARWRLRVQPVVRHKSLPDRLRGGRHTLKGKAERVDGRCCVTKSGSMVSSRGSAHVDDLVMTGLKMAERLPRRPGNHRGHGVNEARF